MGHRLSHHCVTSFAIASDLTDIYLNEKLQDYKSIKSIFSIIVKWYRADSEPAHDNYVDNVWKTDDPITFQLKSLETAAVSS